MVKCSAAQLDATFAALADPTRRAILARLAEGESTVGELAGPFDVTWPAITKHLKVLERARLVKRTKDGRVHRMRLEPRPMRDAQAWIDRYQHLWEQRFDALADYLDDVGADRKSGGKPR